MVSVSGADGTLEYANHSWCDYTGLGLGETPLGGKRRPAS